MADPYLGLLQGLNEGVQSYMDRSGRLEELAARNAEKQGLLKSEEEKEKSRREFELEKLKKEYEYKTQLESQKAKDEKRKDSGPGAGKIVPAGEASSLGESTSAVQALRDYNKLLGNSSDITGTGILKKISRGFQTGVGLLGAQPSAAGERLQVIDSNRKQAAQVIGRFLEGGRMTDADVIRYERMLPQSGDSDFVRQQKEQNLANMIATRQDAIKSSLGGAGYNVSSLPTLQKSSVPQQSQPKSVGPKVGAIEGGYEFMGGNPADQKNWRPVR